MFLILGGGVVFYLLNFLLQKSFYYNFQLPKLESKTFFILPHSPKILQKCSPIVYSTFRASVGNSDTYIGISNTECLASNIRINSNNFKW